LKREREGREGKGEGEERKGEKGREEGSPPCVGMGPPNG